MTGDFLVSRDKTAEFKVAKSEIEEVAEIRSHYFLKIRNGTSIIIPKLKLEDDIRSEIHSLTDRGAKYVVEPGWEWK